MKQDYYELLGVEADADDGTIKKAYRKKALQHHPDKNPENVEESTRIFAEIKAAYEVLSDPQERAWYDSHKSQILSGGSGAGAGSEFDDEYGYNEEEIGVTSDDLMRFFDATLYQRYDDSIAGFYRVAGRVFETIASEEVASGKTQGLEGFEHFVDDFETTDQIDERDLKYPRFGSSTSDYETQVREFYATWTNFSTVKPFYWKDNYKYSSRLDRRTRRAIEKTNKKARDAAKKEYNETVRSFVSFIKKRDVRVKKGVEILEKKRKEKQRIEMEKQFEQMKLDKEKKRQEFEIQDWQKFDPDDIAQMENYTYEYEYDNEKKSQDDETDDPEEIVEQVFECVVCNKVFKSEKQYFSHEQSKKHKKAVKDLKYQMKKEGIELGLDG